MKTGRASVGHPIDVATGVLHNTYNDISIPGKVELAWDRFYSTALLDVQHGLGSGWTNRYFCALAFENDEYLFEDGEGGLVSLPDPDELLKEGDTLRNLGAFTELRKEGDSFFVTQWDVDTGEIWHFVFNREVDGKISPLQQILDVTGQGLDLAYDKNGRLNGVRQKLEKRTLVIQYQAHDLIERVDFLHSDKSIQTLVEYSYDEKGHLVAIADALGHADRFEYDRDHRIVREIVKDGGVFTFKYDDQGRCVRSRGLDGYDEKTLRFQDGAGWTEVTDSLGHVRRFQSNVDGQIIREINALNAEYLSEYDEFGRVIAKTDPNWGVTHFEYDEFGNRTGIIDALGQKTEFKHNEFHLPLSFTNAAGDSWQRIYDTGNRLAAVNDPDGNSYKLAYDSNGNLVKVTDPQDNGLRQSFTGKGILHAATDWQGNVTAYKADEFGRMVQKTDPLGAVTGYEYDALNNLSVVSYPDDTENRYSYDAGTNLTQVVDRNGHTTNYRYGPCNRLLERTDPLDNTLCFGWGSEPQRLQTVTNAKGEVYHFEYNAVGWVIGEIGFDGRALGFEYDLAGNRIASINGLGERISYQRDALGRLAQQLLPDGTSADFAYDSAGFLQFAVNADCAVEFERDALGRIIRETQNGHLIERAYDSVGNLSILESSLGHRMDYQFDANGLLAAFTKDKTDSVQIERDVRGSETGRIFPGSIRLNQQYDAVGRLLEQELVPALSGASRPSLDSAQALIKRNYGYEKAQLVGIQDIAWGNTTYVYDPAEHLINVLRDKGASERFSYDANDNLTEIEQDGELETLTYGRGDRLQVKNDTAYEYDDQGRLIVKRETDEAGEIREWRYVWDALDQLRSFETPEGEIWEYAYDAFGRRIQKKAPDGLRHGFVWDEDVVLHETLDDELSVSWAFDPHSFAPLCKFEKGGVYSVITDHLGTPREMVDRFGRIVWQVDYYAWGEVREQKKGEMDCPVRFQGQWWDEESGLHYNRFRYYEPRNGRFINQDFIRLLAGVKNLYAFLPNVIFWIDPFVLISYLFRGDDTYSGGGFGQPMGSDADITTPWGHVSSKESGQTSRFTSFSETRRNASKFTDGNKVFKISQENISSLQEQGKIRVLTPDDVADEMKRHPDKKVRKQANNVRENMRRNKEILIEGEIPEEAISRCNK